MPNETARLGDTLTSWVQAFTWKERLRRQSPGFKEQPWGADKSHSTPQASKQQKNTTLCSTRLVMHTPRTRCTWHTDAVGIMCRCTLGIGLLHLAGRLVTVRLDPSLGGHGLILVIPLRKIPRLCHSFLKRAMRRTTLKAHCHRMRACDML